MNQESVPPPPGGPPPVGPESKPGFGARIARAPSRIVGVFTSPAKTFQDIGRSPDWFGPALFIVLISVVLGVVMLPYLDIAGAQREALEARDVPQDQIESQLKIVEAFASVFIYAGPVLFVAFMALLALLYWGGTNAFGGSISFSQTYSVVLYAFMAKLVESVLRVAVIFGREPVRADRVDLALPASPAALLSEDVASPGLFAFARALNLFTLYYMVLLAVGLSEAGKLSRGGAYALVFGLFAVYALLVAGFAALTG